MPRSINAEAAQVIALKMLAFLASDSDRLGAFLAASGLGPADLKSGARDPQFLAGVMDYLLGDESLFLAFAENSEMSPAAIAGARRSLPGGGA
jgi:hypothetical protein